MIKLKPFIATLLFFSGLMGNAQYDYEKYRAIKFREYSNWEITAVTKDSMPLQRRIIIKDFDAATSLGIEQDLKVNATDSIGFSVLKLFINNQMIKEFKVKTESIYDPLPVRVLDINGDGLKDIKIVFPNFGSGGYNYYCDAVYLFQNKNGTFKEIMFTDIFEEFKDKLERDFNNDGQYEIITQTFQHHGKHNYWVYNLYDYKNGKLINVNSLADYPIMVPLDSYNISKKIPRKTMKKYSIKTPKLENE